jgi:hypothetical protein
MYVPAHSYGMCMKAICCCALTQRKTCLQLHHAVCVRPHSVLRLLQLPGLYRLRMLLRPMHTKADQPPPRLKPSPQLFFNTVHYRDRGRVWWGEGWFCVCVEHRGWEGVETSCRASPLYPADTQLCSYLNTFHFGHIFTLGQGPSVFFCYITYSAPPDI